MSWFVLQKRKLCGAVPESTPHDFVRPGIYAVTVLAMTLANTCPAIASESASAFLRLPGGEEIKIVESAFIAERFDIKGCAPTSDGCQINGRRPLGVAIGLPKTYVREIAIGFKGRSYQLDASGMYNALSERQRNSGKIDEETFGGECWNESDCTFRGRFSDAAGAYVAEWQIRGGVVTRTVLTDSHDIVRSLPLKMEIYE